MADLIYNPFFREMGSGSHDFDTPGDYKLMLVTSAYTPDKTHATRSQITNEVSGTGYTAGGQSIGNVAITQDDVNDQAVIDGDNVVWNSATFTARGAVMYLNTGNAATDLLVKYFDYVTDRSVTNGPFTHQFGTDGILEIGNPPP